MTTTAALEAAREAKELAEALANAETAEVTTGIYAGDSDRARDALHAAIDALAALAHQEQRAEPVAWMQLNGLGQWITISEHELRNNQPSEVQKLWATATPLYAAPQLPKD